MQNRSMGVGSVGVARGNMAVWGRSTFQLLSCDRNKTQTYLGSMIPGVAEREKSPGQVKNCLGGHGKEEEAESQSKGRGEWGRGQAVLQQAEQWTSSEKRQILCQVDSGSRNRSQAAESLCRAFQKSLCPPPAASVKPVWKQGSGQSGTVLWKQGAGWICQRWPWKGPSPQQDPLRQQQRTPETLGQKDWLCLIEEFFQVFALFFAHPIHSLGILSVLQGSFWSLDN